MALHSVAAAWLLRGCGPPVRVEAGAGYSVARRANRQRASRLLAAAVGHAIGTYGACAITTVTYEAFAIHIYDTAGAIATWIGARTAAIDVGFVRIYHEIRA